MEITQLLNKMKKADQPRINSEQNKPMTKKPKTDLEIKRAYIQSLKGCRR